MNEKERKAFKALEELRDNAPMIVRRTKWYNAFKRHLERLKKADKVKPKKKAEPKKKETVKAPAQILSLEDAHDEANRILEASK